MCDGIQELERGTGKPNPFFSILLTNKFSKSFLQWILRNMHSTLNRDCFTCVGLCMMKCNSAIFWGVVKASPLTTAGMKSDLSAGFRLPTPLWRSRKNRIVKNCNTYPTGQYVVVTYFSLLRPCIQSWLETINELDFKSDACDHLGSSIMHYISSILKKKIY